jgi:hypothetical protein
MSRAFLELITPTDRDNRNAYGVTPSPYWVAYELEGDRRTYYPGPGNAAQHTWPSDAFKSYLWARYKIPRVEPLINGPIYYGGAPLEDLDWEAFPVMEITDLAYEFHELVMFDKMLS